MLYAVPCFQRPATGRSGRSGPARRAAASAPLASSSSRVGWAGACWTASAGHCCTAAAAASPGRRPRWESCRPPPPTKCFPCLLTWDPSTMTPVRLDDTITTVTGLETAHTTPRIRHTAPASRARPASTDKDLDWSNLRCLQPSKKV